MQLVSIIIPLYNAQESILHTLDSIRNQSYSNYEVIVIDDGSTDQSYQYVSNYRIAHPEMELRLLKQSNSGPAKARNYGICESRGDFISFLDSDDCWLPTMLEQQLNIFESIPTLTLLGTAPGIPKQLPMFRSITLNSLLFKNHFTTSSVMIRRNTLSYDELSFNDSQRYAEDYRLWLQLTAKYHAGILYGLTINYGSGKRKFGASGLSARLHKMEQGELSNYAMLYRRGIISILPFIATTLFSLIKYFRRIIISTLTR